MEAVVHARVQGIAQCDIKPSNILLDKYMRPKSHFFDICQRVAPKEMIKGVKGTEPSMAPEIILNSKYCPYRSGVRALSVTFYEITTGARPWREMPKKLMGNAITQGHFTFTQSSPESIGKLININSRQSKR